jgi:hypothetical protein
MGGGVIEQNNDRAAQVPQQLTEKHTDFLLPNVVEEEEIVETQALSLGTERNPRDHRDAVPSSLAVMMDRSLPFRRPGANHRGNQKKARFIGKYYMGAQPRSVFFTRGQTFRFQRLIFSSSCSNARRSGF